MAPSGRPSFILVLALLSAIPYLCFFSHLDALGLVGPDEPRYAAVAREMAESGDWVTPRLNGQPWFEKPALYYWCAALAFRAFGVNEIAARLPSALAALLATLTMAWAAWRRYGRTATWAVLLIFPTCVGAIGFARAATPDMLFSAMLTAAMIAAYSLVENDLDRAAPRRLARVAFGVFLGAAALAKGPAAIVLAAGSAGLWALGTGRWRAALRLAHPIAMAAFCATALPWYVVCAARNPDLARTFLFAHNVERYLTPVFHHVQPFWFFSPVILLGLLPWTLLLAGVARDALALVPRKRWANSPGFFFACWAVFPVLFFSFSQSKLPGYVLPAIPPLVLLLARSTTRWIEEKGVFARCLCAGIGATFVGLAAGSGYWLRRLPLESGLAESRRFLAWMVLAMAGGLAIAVSALMRRPGAALLVTALLMAGLVGAANRRVLPQLDAYLSPRAAARAGQDRAAAGQHFAVFRLHRAWHYGLNFYLHRELPEWTRQSLHGGPESVYTTPAGLAELQRQGVSATVVDQTSPRAWLVRVSGASEQSE